MAGSCRHRLRADVQPIRSGVSEAAEAATFLGSTAHCSSSTLDLSSPKEPE